MSAFDGEQWSWKQVPEAETYLDFVENTIIVYPNAGKRYKVFVSIPTDFFSWLTVFLSNGEMTMAKEHHVRFFLQELGSGKWEFGFEVKKCAALVFLLWEYTPVKFPAWAMKT